MIQMLMYLLLIKCFDIKIISEDNKGWCKIMIDEKQKIKLLSVTKELFDKNDIQYWLLDGGLLGLVRDKKLIPHESDVEIGIWYDDYDKVLDILNKFEKLGYKIKYWGEGFPSIRIFHDDFHVDLKFWIKDENKAVLIGFHHMNRFEDGLFLLKEMIDQIFHSLYLFFCKKSLHLSHFIFPL